MTLYLLRTSARLSDCEAHYRSMVISDLRGILRSALGLAADEPGPEGSFVLALAGPLAPCPLRAAYRTASGGEDDAGAWLSWYAAWPRKRVPDFDGVLRVEGRPDGRAEVVLRGQFRIPSDSEQASGKASTQATATGLVGAIAAELEQRRAVRGPRGGVAGGRLARQAGIR